MNDNNSMQVKLCHDILVSGIVLDELEPVRGVMVGFQRNSITPIISHIKEGSTCTVVTFIINCECRKLMLTICNLDTHNYHKIHPMALDNNSGV